MKAPSMQADPKQQSRHLVQLQPHTRYHQITFGGCGFLLPYHFGAILCLFDNGITTDNAVGISGGAMAALAMLNGSDIYVGLRQGIVDLVNEGCGFILLGLNMLFMNYYFQYMWNFRCLHVSHTEAKRRTVSTQPCEFPLHDMSPSHRASAKALSGRYHVQMVSIAAQDPTGNPLDPLAKTVVGSFLDDSFLRLSAVPGSFGRAMQSMLVPVVIEEYADDASIVQAACLSGGIPGITTFWPRYFNDHFCCLDRMTSAPILINSSSNDLTTFINNQTQSVIPSTNGVIDNPGKCKVPGRMSSWQDMTEDELNKAVEEASQVHKHTVVISPIMHDNAVFRGSDIGICGGYINPFPVFPWQQANRKQAFVDGYRDMQKRIKNPKLLDPTRSKEVTMEVVESDADGNLGEVTVISKTVDSEETLQNLINFILFDSYAKDWKDPKFTMRIDGNFVSSHEAPQNCALTIKEVIIALVCCFIFIGFLLWHPLYFTMTVVSVLAVGAVWIISYLVGVDRINREIEKRHHEELTESCSDSSDDVEGMTIDVEDEVECNENVSFQGETKLTPISTATSPATPTISTSTHRILRSGKKLKYQ